MDRRALVARSLAGLAVGLGWGLVGSARAQQEAALALRETCIALGQSLRERGLDGGLPLSPGEYEELRQEEFGLRKAFVAALGELSPGEAFELAASLGHVDPELFAEYEVDLVPPIEAVEPYPAMELLISRRRAAETLVLPVQQPVEDCEPMWQVILDVVGQAIGIGTIVSDILDVMLEMEPLRGIFDEIEAAIGVGDIDAIVALLFRLADNLFTQELIEAILERIGREAGREFLSKLALRCVPFVGPALVFAGLALTVTLNWERIMRAHACAAETRRVGA